MRRIHLQHRYVAGALFASLFASQAVLIAATPVLAELARDLDVSTAAAAQLRTVMAVTAAVVAVGAGGILRRYDLRTLLLAGLVALGAGSLASGLAPGFLALAAAHVPIGIGIALVLTAGTAAAAEWAPAEHRSRVLSWAITGQPAAWILGMPVLGLVGQTSWRLGWLTVPLAAAVAAFVAVSRVGVKETGTEAPPRASLREALDDARARRWAAGELLANAAWSGTLMFVGALFAESYGTTAGVTGVLLSAIAVVYVCGTFAFRRFAEADARSLLVRLALSLSVGVATFGCLRPNAIVSALVLAVTAFLAGGRVMLGNAFGLTAAPGRRAALMGVRAATAQLGYLLGAAVGGIALALGSYAGLGVVLGALFVAAATALSWPEAAAPAATPEAA